MQFSNLHLLLVAGTAAANVLESRQASNVTEAYIQEVCYPPSTDPVPPCQSIINVESACQPNGTSPLAYDAHSQCMCKGSFFSDWEGCLACQTVHGARSPQIAEAFLDILSSASNILCTGTPTASFQAIFASLSAGSGAGEGGNTGVSDRFPSQTAISLYYTLRTSQGPGAITGSATAATAVQQTTTSQTMTSTGSRGQTTSSGTSRATTSSGTGAGALSTTSSTGGAAPTGVWMGALGAIAGGAVMAAL